MVILIDQNFTIPVGGLTDHPPANIELYAAPEEAAWFTLAATLIS